MSNESISPFIIEETSRPSSKPRLKLLPASEPSVFIKDENDEISKLPSPRPDNADCGSRPSVRPVLNPSAASDPLVVVVSVVDVSPEKKLFILSMNPPAADSASGVESLKPLAYPSPVFSPHSCATRDGE